MFPLMPMPGMTHRLHEERCQHLIEQSRPFRLPAPIARFLRSLATTGVSLAPFARGASNTAPPLPSAGSPTGTSPSPTPSATTWPA
jgi:hypothetical protein